MYEALTPRWGCGGGGQKVREFGSVCRDSGARMQPRKQVGVYM